MRREHLVEKDWDGPGTYYCKCGASIEAVNRDVLNWIFLDHCAAQAAKQARAEVLAASVAKLGDLIVSRQGAATKASKDGKEGLAQIFVDERDGIKSAIRALKELQPAAKDLEALLREARLEEAKLRPHQDGCAALLTGAEADDCDDWCGRDKRIAELEKARAGIEKQ